MNDRNIPRATRALRGRRHLRAALTAALGTALLFSAGAAQSTQQPSKEVVVARVDSMVRGYMAEKGLASMSVAISRGNETMVERAWGLADIAANRPATAANIYNIGSVSKQFTATLVLRQVERGNLALSDSIGRYLTTGLRPEWRPLTIEQLLNHTSGLQNDINRQGVDPSGEVPVDTMMARAARDAMASAPGTSFLYSNVGYLLLGVLIEKLYGNPYAEVIRAEIAGPLGLRTLGWCTQPTDSTATTGYFHVESGELQPAPYIHPSFTMGMGGLCSTAGDLAVWNRALHGGRVVSPASYVGMITPRGAAAPPGPGFGFGLHVNPPTWGMPAITHNGNVPGFAAQNAWFPAESLSVTVLYSSAKGPPNPIPTNFLLEIARAISAPAQ